MRSIRTYYKYLYYALHYGTPGKFYNYILNTIEKRFRRVCLRSLPIYVTIEPGNVCNLHCPECITGAGHPGAIGPQMLTFEQFESIFSRVAGHVLNVCLYHWGEPFLNKDIFRMISHATAHRCGTTVHSNFNVWDESRAQQAVESGLTHIYVAADGATQESYEKYRRGGDLARVLQNIDTLVKKKRELRSRFPLVTWKFLVFPHNAHEVEEARRMAAACGVDAFEVFSANLANLATFGSGQFYDLSRSGFETFSAMTCDALWDSVFINPDGAILPCCQAYRRADVFGNINTHSLREIWNNEEYQELRRVVSGRSRSRPIRPPCAGCAVIANLRKSGPV